MKNDAIINDYGEMLYQSGVLLYYFCLLVCSRNF